MTPRRIQITLIAATIALLAARAHAGGHVLRIEQSDIYVDLGARDGVGAGTRLVLYHEVVAKNPVTGATLRDRFPLGQLTVTRAGEHLAVAVAPEDIAHRVAVGDQVELATDARAFIDPWQRAIEVRTALHEAGAAPGQAPATTPGAPSERQQQARQAVAAAAAAEAAWQATMGQAPAERIAVWEAYLGAHGDSPYAAAVTREIASLRQQMAAEESIRVQLADPAGRRAEIRAAQLAAVLPALDLDAALAVLAPADVYEGTALALAFAVLAPGQVARAWLYYRGPGDEGFARVALRPDGDAYLRGAIPADAVRPPSLDYFVEVAAPDEAPSASPDAGSTPRAVLGSQQEPRRIAVQPRMEEPPPDLDDRSRVTMLMDYVDFDGGLGGGFDQYLHAEMDFMYRFIRPIYAVRVGFGTLGGVGGPKDLIDASPDDCLDGSGMYRCRRVDYNYAYIELEHRFSDTVAVMLRPQLGRGSSDLLMNGSRGRCNTANSASCDNFNDLGVRARIRFGDERTTNLTLGVGLSQNVGNMFEAAYTWSVIPRFPVKLAAQVTDQPVPEDFGVRLITDVGWRAVSWVYPSVRIAYQARDVDHSGISGGLAANFDW